MNEIIYILINEAMPGYVKIGMTGNLEERIRSLDNTSMPLPFECYYAATVKNAREVEKLMHDIFLDHRVRSNREFFELAPDRAVSALKLVAIEDVTPKRDFVETDEDQKALNQARERRSIFNFAMVGIPVGTELTYLHDENIKAKVIDNRSIELNGEVTSLSNSARKLLGSQHPVQGTLYWTYQEEALDSRRRRLESSALASVN